MCGVADTMRAGTSESKTGAFAVRTVRQLPYDRVMQDQPSLPPAAAPEPRPAPRERQDRRAHPEAGRRGRRPPSRVARFMRSAGGDVVMIVLLIAAIGFIAQSIPRVLDRQRPLAQRLLERMPERPPAAVAARPGEDPRAAIVRTPEYQRDKTKFAADLVATGRMDPARADSVAGYVVRESHLRGVPPALIFGLMLTENSRFERTARSNVGAVGIMQIYPKVWLRPLGKEFGTDLESDSTNVKYGVFILSQYFKPKRGETESQSWRRAFLRYNGCVRGTNTPNCHTYPDKIQRYVEREGRTLCAGQGFYDCIAKPFRIAFLGESGGDVDLDAPNPTPKPPEERPTSVEPKREETPAPRRQLPSR